MSILLRRTVACGLPLAGLAVAAASLMLAPPFYRGRCLVALVPESPAAPLPTPEILWSDNAREALRQELAASTLTQKTVPEAAPAATEGGEEQLEKYLSRLNWKRFDSASLFELTFDSSDPELAAAGANLAASMLEELVASGPTERASVQKSLTQLEEEIEAVGREQVDLALLREQHSTAQQTAAALREMMSRSRAARLEFESRWRTLEQATPEMLLGSVDSPELDIQRSELSALEQRRDELSVRFGPKWPEMKELLEQIEAVQAHIDSLVSTLAEEALRQAEIDYRQALVQEQEHVRLLGRQRREIQQLQEREAEQQARQRLLAEKQAERKVLLARLERPSASGTPVRLQRVSAASTPTRAHGMPPWSRLAGGALIGLLLGAAAVRLVNRLDPLLCTPTEAETALDAPLLACLPEIPGGPPAGPLRLESAPAPGVEGPVSPLAATARGFRDLRTGLLLARGGEPARVLLVTACRRGEGKTFVASHVALALAQRGSRVLLIDTHFKRPQAHRLFGVSPGPGLVDTLAGRVPLEEALHPTDEAGLFVLPAGDVNGGSQALLDAASLRHLRDRLLQPSRFDHLVIDAGDVGTASAPERLVVACTGVLMLIRARRTARREVRQAAATIRRHGISYLAGVWIGEDPAAAPASAPAGGAEAQPRYANEADATPAAAPSVVGAAFTGTDEPAGALDPEVLRRLERLRSRLGGTRGAS